jgi:hypothetical protein
MDIINLVSIIGGSAVLLGLFLSIAYEGIVTRGNPKKLVSALDDKWHKLLCRMIN